MTSTVSVRRKFLDGLAGLWAVGFARGELTSSAPSAPDEHPLPEYALQQHYTSLKQSSYDRSGGNSDRWLVAVGETKEVFDTARLGIISTLGVLQNAENWMGEGDEMVFVDDDSKPAISGAGSEDYFCDTWDFAGSDNSGSVIPTNYYDQLCQAF